MPPMRRLSTGKHRVHGRTRPVPDWRSSRWPPLKELQPSAYWRLMEDLAPSIEIDLRHPDPAHNGLDPDAEGVVAAALQQYPGRGYPSQAEAAAVIASHLGADPEDIVVTCSTSESYGLLAKLLVNPGDRVAIPSPSYPLLGHLLKAEAVEVEEYALELRDGRWTVDPDQLTDLLEQGVQAVLAVQPNNPTGSTVDAESLHAVLQEFPLVSLISDEVFAPYHWAEQTIDTLGREDGNLTFVLDGLSKRGGMAQMKLGWIRCGGAPQRRAEAVAGLRFLADNQLSLNGLTRKALPQLLDQACITGARIHARVRDNRVALRQWSAGVAEVDLLQGVGGWQSLLRLPQLMTDAAWVLHLAQQAHVQVQPGFFYDIGQSAVIVLSLLAPPERFNEGMQRLKHVIDEVVSHSTGVS